MHSLQCKHLPIRAVRAYAFLLPCKLVPVCSQRHEGVCSCGVCGATFHNMTQVSANALLLLLLLLLCRCKVRAYGAPPSHTFYLLTASGALPSKAQVIQVCQAAGGELLEAPLLEGALLSGGGPGTAAVLRGLELRGHFGFYVRERRALVPASIVAAAGGSGVPGAGGRGQQQGGVGGSMRGGVERGGAVSVPAARGIACPAGRPGAAQSGGSSFDSDGGVDSF
jgi:hypothetical protein